MMLTAKTQHIRLWVVIVVIAAAMLGCQSTEQNSRQHPPELDHVHPVFRQNWIDASSITGPPITKAFEIDKKTYQYFQNGLMVFDPYASEANRIRMYPLSIELGYQGSPGNQPYQDSMPGSKEVNGYTIYALFVPIYEKFGGNFLGLPGSEVLMFVDEQNGFPIRVIYQVFANMVVFWVADTPEDAIRVYSLGAIKCAPGNNEKGIPCRSDLAIDNLQSPKEELTIPIGNAKDIPEPYISTILRLRTIDLGQVLGFITKDNMELLVMEKAVFFRFLDRQSPAYLYPTAQSLNLLYSPPGPPRKLSGLTFIAIDLSNQIGYDMPDFFLNFINKHGGTGTYGDPIGQYYLVENGLYRQCLESVCIDYDQSMPEGFKLRLAPIGQLFLDLYAPEFRPPVARGEVYSLTPSHIKILSTKDTQRFTVHITHPDQAVNNLAPVLEISVPGQKPLIYDFPITNLSGITELYIPVSQQSNFKGINGVIVNYKICLLESNPAVCTHGNYLIKDS